MHLFTTEDAEDTEVNLVHAGTEMNEMTCILGIFVQYKQGYMDTRVSLVLTPGCQVYQHPGVSAIETRVSYNLFM